MIDVVRPLDLLEGPAAVDALEHAQAGAPDHVRVHGIDGDDGEVPRPYLQIAVRVDKLPFAPTVVGAVQAALLRLNEGVNAFALSGDVQADASPDSSRQAVVLELLPDGAAVGGLVEAAARPAAGETPGCSPHLPQGGEKDPRIRRVHAEIDG